MVKIKRNDTARTLSATLYANDEVIDLTGATIFIIIKNCGTDDESVRQEVAPPNEPETGVVTYEFTEEDTAVAGDFFIEFEVTFPSGKEITVPNSGYYHLLIEPDLG